MNEDIKRINTKKILDKNNIEYRYDEIEDLIVIDRSISINDYDLGDMDFLLYRVKVNGNVSMRVTTKVGDYFLMNSIVTGAVWLNELKTYGSYFLNNCVIGADINLQSITQLENDFLCHRYINGNLHLNSLVNGDNLHSIVLVGVLYINNIKHCENTFLLNSIINGKIEFSDALIDAFRLGLIQSWYINPFKNEYTKFHSKYHVLKIDTLPVISNLKFILYGRNIEGYAEIKQPLDLSFLSDMYDMSELLDRTMINYPLRIKSLDLYHYKSIRMINNSEVHIRTDKNECIDDDNIRLNLNAVVKYYNYESGFPMANVMYESESDEPSDEIKGETSYDVDLSDIYRFIYNDEYLYHEKVGLIKYADITFSNMNLDDYSLNIIKENGTALKVEVGDEKILKEINNVIVNNLIV